MEILNLEGPGKGNRSSLKSRKKLRVILGVGTLAAVTAIGSTLAANIALNDGGNVEFGQGVATTAACDNDITLTPVSTFSNTAEDPAFAMTEIQVSNIDLTPEGWDVLANDGNGGWASGYTPEYYDADTDTFVEATWTGAAEGRAGQYKNSAGAWTNTCANKFMMLRAYTDNSEYVFATDGDNINTPLMLNGADSHRPDNREPNAGYNHGVGFRFVTYPENDNANWAQAGFAFDRYEISDNDGDFGLGADFDPIGLSDSLDGDGTSFSDSTIFITLVGDSVNPPLDSRWVDKLTVESSAQLPDNWTDNW